jgi:hypothetical protein
MRSTDLLIGAVLLMGLVGCGPPPPVQIAGAPADIESLAGEWTGSYKSRDSSRDGTIWFKLVAGEDHAHGDVLMTPPDRSEAYARLKPGELPGQGDAPRFLAIRFVAVSRGEVSGSLEPYWDPECDCEARTEFRGRQYENTFEGSFVTRLTSGLTKEGRWTATRSRK